MSKWTDSPSTKAPHRVHLHSVQWPPFPVSSPSTTGNRSDHHLGFVILLLVELTGERKRGEEVIIDYQDAPTERKGGCALCESTNAYFGALQTGLSEILDKEKTFYYIFLWAFLYFGRCFQKIIF